MAVGQQTLSLPITYVNTPDMLRLISCSMGQKIILAESIFCRYFQSISYALSTTFYSYLVSITRVIYFFKFYACINYFVLIRLQYLHCIN